MMDMNSIDDYITLKRQSPHLFILGAGATMAAIPCGDKFGRKSSAMNNFLSNIGKQYLLDDIELETTSTNIEEIYSELHRKSDDPRYKEVADTIEDEIYDYFSQMQLPDEPTMYDYLIISLRHKDCIASFNWDPLLIQAYNRVNKITRDLPQMVFLHGNVAAAICTKCNKYQPRRNVLCYDCKSILQPSKLLYPVEHKDYHTDVFIAGQWAIFNDFINRAALISIWGYSAPSSDIEAKNAMLDAYSSQFRKLDDFEVIDVKSYDDIYTTWNDFLKENNGHLKYMSSLSESLVAKYPRRSTEGYCHQYLKGNWNGSAITLDCDETFDELQEKLTPLLENEDNKDYSVIVENYKS